jgi:hypothetical protein
MDAFGGLPEDDRDDDEEETSEADTRERTAVDNDDHEDVLRLITAENVEAAMDLFFEAKDPNIDPALKLKLIGLASKVGDNARKGIATCAACFGRRI